jgi:hypothetical protein
MQVRTVPQPQQLPPLPQMAATQVITDDFCQYVKF